MFDTDVFESLALCKAASRPPVAAQEMDGMSRCHIKASQPSCQHLRCIDVDGRMVGFLSFKVVTEDLEDQINCFVSIEHVFVVERLRRSGIASRMIEAVVSAVINMRELHGDRPCFIYQSSLPESEPARLLSRKLSSRLVESCAHLPAVRDFF